MAADHCTWKREFSEKYMLHGEVQNAGVVKSKRASNTLWEPQWHSIRMDQSFTQQKSFRSHDVGQSSEY